MLDGVDENSVSFVIHRVNNPVVADAVPVIVVQSPFQLFDLRTGERIVLQNIQTGLNGATNGRVDLSILSHRMG